MNVQRYKPCTNYSESFDTPYPSMCANDKGEYVKYVDMEAALKELQDWRELSYAVMSLPIAAECRKHQLWPNKWHQDCAAVAFFIHQSIEADKDRGQ